MDGLTMDLLVRTFGAPGIFIGYMIWREMRRDKADTARTSADVQLAVALSALTEKIKDLAK